MRHICRLGVALSLPGYPISHHPVILVKGIILLRQKKTILHTLSSKLEDNARAAKPSSEPSQPSAAARLERPVA
jgi:hypothetical protein